MLGMQERVKLLEGDLIIDHRCDKGTMVMATVPWKNGKNGKP
jgi:signal transduction histidine kinase